MEPPTKKAAVEHMFSGQLISQDEDSLITQRKTPTQYRSQASLPEFSVALRQLNLALNEPWIVSSPGLNDVFKPLISMIVKQQQIIEQQQNTIQNISLQYQEILKKLEQPNTANEEIMNTSFDMADNLLHKIIGNQNSPNKENVQHMAINAGGFNKFNNRVNIVNRDLTNVIQNVAPVEDYLISVRQEINSLLVENKETISLCEIPSAMPKNDPRRYFNVICQICSFPLKYSDRVLIMISDGTQIKTKQSPFHPIHDLVDKSNTIFGGQDVSPLYPYLYVVECYEMYANDAEKLKPHDLVRINNIRFTESITSRCQETFKLGLHGFNGEKYNRGIKILKRQ